jgi:hypothetical protein
LASMDDKEYFPLRHLGGAEVGVQPTLDGKTPLLNTATRAGAWLYCT